MKAMLLLLKNPMRDRVVNTLRGVSSPPVAVKTMNVNAIMTGTAIPKLNACVKARATPPLRMSRDSDLQEIKINKRGNRPIANWYSISY